MTLSSLSSKSKVPQVNPMIRPTCDPEKQEAHAKPSGDLVPCDQTRDKSPVSLALGDDLYHLRSNSTTLAKWFQYVRSNNAVTRAANAKVM